MDTLTLFDFSDRELLFIVLDETDPASGYARTEDISKALGMDGKYPNRNVGIRLAWLKRWGAVTKREKGSLWQVTQIGEDLINGKLRTPHARMIDEASSSELLLLTRQMTQRYRATGYTAGTLIRREWRRGTSNAPRSK